MIEQGTHAYDVIVIGSGSGATIVDNALYRGMRVAWVDRGPGGSSERYVLQSVALWSI